MSDDLTIHKIEHKLHLTQHCAHLYLKPFERINALGTLKNHKNIFKINNIP